MESKLSSILPEYKFGKMIGTGSYGKVYFIRDKSSQKCYALKVLKKSKIITSNQIENTYSEYQITKQISHPFVVPLQKFYQDEYNLYFFFDFIPGGELLTLMRNDICFSPENTQFIIAQIICALNYLHSNRIIYRDLKPENILFDATGYIKLTDFGISKELSNVCKTYTLAGTPTYMAPEIFMNRGYSFNADWWSLGVLTYEMLIGVDPWDTEDPMEIFDKIMKGKIFFKKGMDKDAKNFIQRLLVGDPENRLGNKIIDGKNEIFYHKWFKNYDFKSLENKTISPWHIPKLK